MGRGRGVESEGRKGEDERAEFHYPKCARFCLGQHFLRGLQTWTTAMALGPPEGGFVLRRCCLPGRIIKLAVSVMYLNTIFLIAFLPT